MKRNALALLLIASLAGAAEVHGAPANPTSTTHDRLVKLAEDVTYTTARYQPLRATELGLPGHDGELEVPGEAARRARIERLRAWTRQLASITRAAGPGISLVDADDAKLMQASIDADLDDLLLGQTDRKDYAGPALRLVGAIFSQFLHLPLPERDGATQGDLVAAWNDLIARMAQAPDYIRAGQRLVTHPGRLYGIVGIRQLEGVPDFLNGALSDAAKAQLQGDPGALDRFARARDAMLATVAQTRTFLEAHAQAWPENFAIGKKGYERILRDDLLLPFDAADVVRLGEDALAHGWAEEAWLQSTAQQHNLQFGAATGGGMAPSGPPLVDYYRDRIDELRRFVEKAGVVTIPATLGTMEIVETPAFLQPVAPGASMMSPRLFSESTRGYYFITPPASLEQAAARLDMNQDFDRDRILSTAAHEAIPGHFVQLSIARRHPDFVRRIQFSGSFAEGWAFYGEEMFVRLGLYGDDLDARLFTARWERVRGARAIVDVKLASGEWSVPRAVAFFEGQSGFTHEAAEAAVNGYALGPGYVIAYVTGRFQLERLLAEYQHRMGERGSLHDFHDRLLSYGTTPFAILGPELLADLDKSTDEVRRAANF